MRPNGQEIVRGVSAALATYVLPELQTAYARTELMAALALLGIAAEEWDGATQRLVDDNATLRALAQRAGEALEGDLANELTSLATQTDASLRISDLAPANAALRHALGRLAPLLEESDEPALSELRAELIERLIAEAEARSRHLMGPRADG